MICQDRVSITARVSSRVTTIADHSGQGVAERPLGADDVVVESADERARTSACEERDRHALHMIEDSGPQIEDQSLAEVRREPAAEESERRLGERDQGDEQGESDDGALVAAGHDRVDDAPGEDRGRDGEQRGHHAEDHELGDAAAVRTGEGGDAAQGRAGEGAAFLLGVHDAVQLRPGRGLHTHGSDRRTSSNVEVKAHHGRHRASSSMPGASAAVPAPATPRWCGVETLSRCEGTIAFPRRFGQTPSAVRQILCLLPLALVTVVAVQHRSVLAEGFGIIWRRPQWPWLWPRPPRPV